MVCFLLVRYRYEGTGRSLSLKLLQQLRQQSSSAGATAVKSVDISSEIISSKLVLWDTWLFLRYTGLDFYSIFYENYYICKLEYIVSHFRSLLAWGNARGKHSLWKWGFCREMDASATVPWCYIRSVPDFHLSPTTNLSVVLC